MSQKKDMIIIFITFFCTFDIISTKEKKDSFLFGIDNFEEYSSLFLNKRVGLITNPTGITKWYESSIDFLFRKVSLVSLFAPEHGIRGNSQAGSDIGEEIDVKTNLIVYSLYGKTQKPTKEMLEYLDILAIDLQDVGSRYYTYIYTMARAMEACKENGKTFVVFDRPNPIGGNILEGNILEEEHSSGVGLFPIIVRHGMTIGELAQLFNSEFDIGCDLKIVQMKNYNRSLFYDEYNDIPWVSPSPNMPTVDTAVLYPGTCLFEGVNVSEGRGTTKPFEYIGAPFINPFKWSDVLNDMNLPGVYFRPVYFTPTFEDFEGEQCSGVQVHVTDRDSFQGYKTGIAMVYTVKQMYPERVEFLQMLKKLTGSDFLYDMKMTLNEMFDKIDKDVEIFMETRKKYLIYE